MKITLRKAAKIRNALEAKVNEIYRDVTETKEAVNVYDPEPIAVINARYETFQRTYAKYISLTKVLYGLRSQISAANSRVGVSANLTNIAMYNSLLGVVSRISKGTPRLTDEQINNRLVGIRDKIKSGGFGVSDIVDFNFLPTTSFDSLENEQKNLKRAIDDLHEVNERLNMTSIIDISDKAVQILQMNGLL